ncbi:G/U mismatch-specific DNA glycosylase (plasmid) [Nitrobacter sp. NHB1]|uniref:G/U mismatch-specific DNA glycosylase n=1 Tax=Nitrobacter sp. NHB1 TaxID=3119830 RepID=UPI002FFF6FF4
MVTYDPDILARGLDVIFCGVNPALSAAIAGHNFSNSSNRFWPALHLAGFTDVRLQPQNERRLLEYRCGITVVVLRPTNRAQNVSPEEFQQAWHSFEAKVRQYAPRAIAFLGKRAFSIMTGQPDPAWGRQWAEFADTTAWLLPNPSGRNLSFTLGALVSAYAELRMVLARLSSVRSTVAVAGDKRRRAAGGGGRAAQRMRHPIKNLYHLAEADNLASLIEHGLMSTEGLLDLVRIAEPERKELLRRHRPENVRLSESVMIRDQRPMPPAVLAPALDDGLLPSDWYTLLNGFVRLPMASQIASA